MCIKTQLYESEWAKKHLSTAVRNSLVSRTSFWLLGFCTGLALFVEEERRRAELAMYVLPKGLESAWSMMRNRGYMPFIPFGDSIVSLLNHFVFEGRKRVRVVGLVKLTRLVNIALCHWDEYGHGELLRSSLGFI